MTDRGEILQKLAEFLKADTELSVENLSEDLSMREGLGLDSVDLVGIVMRIEGHYRIRLSHSDLEGIATIGNLIDLIEAKIAASGVTIEGGAKAE